MKTCKICGKSEPVVGFSYGHLRCKPCASKRAVEWAKNNSKRKLASNKQYLSTPKGNKAIYKKTLLFRRRFPKKYSAYIAVQTAIRNGSMKRKSCEICGIKKTHAHHDDYNKPLLVRWLCELCHVRIHRIMLKEREK